MYNLVEVTFEDGHTVGDYRDSDEILNDLIDLHGKVSQIDIDGEECPLWLYEMSGMDAVTELALWFDRTNERNKPAVFTWMEDQKYSNPEPWQEFEQHYIGEFESDEEFGYHIVHERAEAEGIEIPRWLDDLIDYSREFDSAMYWQDNGYYFYH